MEFHLRDFTERKDMRAQSNATEKSSDEVFCCSFLQKYSKEVQEVKQKNQEEIRKLRQTCEDKDDKIKTLNHKLLQDAQEKWVDVKLC